MKTEVLKIYDIKKDYNKIEQAAQYLKKGEVVAIPTETVYGLAANIFDVEAAKKIFIAKGRPQDNPLIAHIHDLEQINEICCDIPKSAMDLAKKFWPGPLTIILKKKKCVPDVITAGLDTIAVRFPVHPVAREIICVSGTPLVAPSANISGKPSTTSAKHCIDDLTGKIPLIIDGGDCEIGLESTIIDMTIESPTILRLGAITPQDILDVIPNVKYETGSSQVQDKETPKAPGMKYRHYSPNAPLTLVKGSPEATAKWILENMDESDGVLCFDEFKDTFIKAENTCALGSYLKPRTNANKLFTSLRKFDELNVKKIYSQCPEESGLGLAIINRLKKASGGNIVEV